MNAYTSSAISNAAMWLATGAAVSVAVYLTGKASPLWFMLIPMLATLCVRQTGNDT